jgi:hypothetical protein
MCRSRDLLLRLTVVRENVVHRRFSIPTESDTGRESANDLPEAELPQLVETPSACYSLDRVHPHQFWAPVRPKSAAYRLRVTCLCRRDRRQECEGKCATSRWAAVPE